MGFILGDLVIESILRDGLEKIRKDHDILNNLFVHLSDPHIKRKYGSKEIEKIKTLFSNNAAPIAITHAMSPSAAKIGSYSVQLHSDKPTEDMESVGEITGHRVVEAHKEKSPLVTMKSYDSATGKIEFDDDVDLSAVRPNHVVVQGEGKQMKKHRIKRAISNNIGRKFIFVDTGLSLDPSKDVEIRGATPRISTKVKGAYSTVGIKIGVHSKSLLVMKYLYTVLKYIIRANRLKIEDRGFLDPRIEGYDYEDTKDEIKGDIVFSRYITIFGDILESWDAESIEGIEDVSGSFEPSIEDVSGSFEPSDDN